MINFVFDHVVHPQLGYPNLAQPNLAPDAFDHTPPRATPLRLMTYFKDHSINWRAWTRDQAPVRSWYPVSLAWFDHTLDYMVLLDPQMKQLVASGHIKILFYYHEADNPGPIKSRLDFLGTKHQLPEDYYLFVSGNTSAEFLDNFFYFSDLELFFKFLNHQQPVSLNLTNQRPYKFTALNRTHKWWRATVMADLHRCNLLTHSQWSYNTDCSLGEGPAENPIIIDTIGGLSEYISEFVDHGPYFCDSDNADSHNDHTLVNTDLYTKSYCHIVIETLFDTNQSGGAFITEKTYKAIKYGQPFVIVGAVGSLATLRRAGYRTFDHAIDNRYDLIHDNTHRWLAVRRAIAQLQLQNMHQWFESCQADIEHNQNHYLHNRPTGLDRLIDRLSYKP
jgi:hypothetical protein